MSGVAVVLAAACALTLVTTTGRDVLPVLMVNNQYTSAMMFVNLTVWLPSGGACCLVDATAAFGSRPVAHGGHVCMAV